MIVCVAEGGLGASRKGHGSAGKYHGTVWIPGIIRILLFVVCQYIPVDLGLHSHKYSDISSCAPCCFLANSSRAGIFCLCQTVPHCRSDNGREKALPPPAPGKQTQPLARKTARQEEPQRPAPSPPGPASVPSQPLSPGAPHLQVVLALY